MQSPSSQADGKGPAPKLKVSNVTKQFENRDQPITVLQDINLQVEEGEFVVLFGPSGCGKSTLLNLIAGFYRPTSGEMMLEGQPIVKPGSDRLMMFQEHALFPWLRVIDNVMYGLKWKREYRFRPAARRATARSLLKLVHLEEFERTRVHELSGGMKQRVTLARALAPDPKLLLIDEPFPALDALVRAVLYTELQDILVRTKKTIISVTHDPREAACLGDRVIVLTARPGRIKSEIRVDLARPRDINDPRVAEYALRIAAELEQEEKHDERAAKAS